MRAALDRKRQAQRAQLSSDVDAFLASGGEIQRCDHTANRGHGKRRKMIPGDRDHKFRGGSGI